MALGTVTGTVDDTDIDPTGLGRWASVRMTGRGGKKVQIVSAYNPNKTSERNISRIQCIPNRKDSF